MKLVIERPEWDSLISKNIGSRNINNILDKWFTENVEPINKVLCEGVEVYGLNKFFNSGITRGKTPIDTHKALLINIQPIKCESAEDVLRDLIASKEDNAINLNTYFDLIKRAKRALGEEL